jgi:O-Antigen ligase
MVVEAVEPKTSENKPGTPNWETKLEFAGYISLIGLAILLPFELTQVPLIQLPPFFVLSNLEVVFYVCTLIATLTLVNRAWQGWQTGRRVPDWRYWLFSGAVGWCLVSSVLGSFVNEGLKWTLGMIMGGVFALAIPDWFKTKPTEKLRRLLAVLVATAVVSAGVGWLEFMLDTGFSQSLGWFKVRPTTAGPYLRLSGTFEYANIAAIYYEMMLALAVVGFVVRVREQGSGNSRKSDTQHPTSNILELSLITRHSPLVMWLLAVVVLYEAILLTFSRAALFGTVAALGFLALMWWWVRGWRKAWTIGLAVTAVAIFIATVCTWLLQPVMGLRFTTQSDQDWYKAGYISQVPATLSLCQQISLPVTVKNEGSLLWEANIKRPYYLSYHWLREDSSVFFFEGIRSPLPLNIAPGASGVIEAKLKAPEKAGNYLLVWDMVQENVSWFSLKSAVYQKIPVQITALPSEEAKVACELAPGEAENRAKPAPKELPKVLPQPNRDQLWATAIEMIKAKPLFGVGPDNYRFVYGNYTTPKLAEWDKRIFANNTPLELGANLGISGAILFSLVAVSLFWRNVWRILKSVKSSVPLTTGQILIIGLLAAIVAFTAHGVLDYFFGSRPIFYLMWLVLGLAGLENSGQGSGNRGQINTSKS